jgi:hypothetical protein
MAMTQEIQVVEVGHAQEGGLTTPGDDVVQALGLVSSSAQIRTPELHGVLLMLPTGKYNQAVCAALVQNLTFYDDKRLLAYQGRYPDTSVRFTYIYDGRSEQELKSIERPPHFSRPDCPEIVSNFDFDLSYYLTGLFTQPQARRRSLANRRRSSKQSGCNIGSEPIRPRSPFTCD